MKNKGLKEKKEKKRKKTEPHLADQWGSRCREKSKLHYSRPKQEEVSKQQNKEREDRVQMGVQKRAEVG